MGRKPPKFATWLLNNFGRVRHNRAMIGDLCEEFRDGRSRSWYWRQTIFILARRLGREACSAYSAGALIIGVFLALVDYAFWSLNRPPHQHQWVWGLGVWDLAGSVFAILIAAWVLAGWIWKRPSSGWEAAGKAVAWIAFICFRAWTSTDSLATRLQSDVLMVACAVVFLTIFGSKLRARMKKPR
jgi:hypothetical protein